MQRVALLNWNNINQDYDLSAIFEAFANVSLWWVINWLELNNWVITPWRAFVKVNRNWRQFFVLFENTEDVSIDTSTDGKIFIKINEANIVDGTANNEDGTWIWQIVKDTNFPTANYLPLAEIVWGSVNDLREFVKLDEKVLEGLNADKLDFSSMSKDITTTWTITAQSFVWDGSWLTNLPPSPPFYFGDWSDWDLVITSWTTNLNLNQVYQFASISIASGAVVSTNDTMWVLLIKCKWDCQVDWTIDLYWKWWIPYNSLLFWNIEWGSSGNWWDAWWYPGWNWWNASVNVWGWWWGWGWEWAAWDYGYWWAWWSWWYNIQGWAWYKNSNWKWWWDWGGVYWWDWENAQNDQFYTETGNGWNGSDWGWGWGWSVNTDNKVGCWGWGWAWWISWWWLILYSFNISWNWNINLNWMNWWNWGDASTYNWWKASGWGWWWGWGWGFCAIFSKDEANFSISVNWWSWGTAGNSSTNRASNNWWDWEDWIILTFSSKDF